MAKAKARSKPKAKAATKARAKAKPRTKPKTKPKTKRRTPAQIVADLRTRAERGDGVAARKLGDHYFRNQVPDLREALRWYRAGADAGDDDSAQNTAYLLRSGETADVPAADRFLDTMVAAGRAWAIREHAALAAAAVKESKRGGRMAMSDEAKLRELVTRFDLVPRLAALHAVARPSVALFGRAAPRKLPLGTSRLGGDPDVGADVAWPTRAGKPLGFLGQLELAALQRLVPDPAVPADGLLVFFYDLAQQPWGAPDERDAWTVLHVPAGTPLVRRASPPGAPTIAPFVLDAVVELTLPPVRSAAFRDLGFDEAEARRYVELVGAYAGEYCRQPAPTGDVHRFLGHPDALQGDMSRRIEYGARGVDVDVAVPALELAARRWRLLFQVGSDFNQHLNWSDNGRLYFWIRDVDLAERRFGDTMLQLQSH